MSLDQKKAFHLVDRDFVFQVLEKMNFNKDVLAVIKALYQKKHQLRFRSMGISQKALICNEGKGRDAPSHLHCMWCTLNPSLLISLVRVVLWASNCHIGSPRFLLMQTIFLLFCRDQKDVNCNFLLLNILRSSSV